MRNNLRSLDQFLAENCAIPSIYFRKILSFWSTLVLKSDRLLGRRLVLPAIPSNEAETPPGPPESAGKSDDGKHEIEKKVRDLAGEILNDWDAVVAVVYDATLPPTNNEAERALRHAVIARRISFGTRTDEGSRFYAAGLGVIDTCRKRGADPWAYACRLIAAARANLPLPPIPANAAA
jgi:hypothetical protein